MAGHVHEWFDDFRIFIGSWSWKSIMMWAVTLAAAAALIVRTVKQPTSPPSSPRPAVVVSYHFTPMSGGCGIGGVEAWVRLNNGQIVSAATYQYGYDMVYDGALVTVQKFRVLCGPAPYTILHGGPPDASNQRTSYARR
jgi:hypothetical protein